MYKMLLATKLVGTDGEPDALTQSTNTITGIIIAVSVVVVVALIYMLLKNEKK